MKKGWQTKKLGEVCQFRGGGTPSKAVDRYWRGDIPWVSPKDMKFDVVSDSIDHISREAIDRSATSLIPKDSVLMVVRSGILARTVPIAITGRDLTINQDLKALCPNATLDAHFLYYLLDSKMDVLLSMVSRGATVHRLMTEQIRALDFNLPPLPEQHHIVAILDEAFAGIATATANAERNRNNAREVFESALHELFGQKSDSWEERTLDQIAENLDSKRVPVTKSSRKSGLYPYYGASGVVDYVDDFIFDENLLLVSEDGANLLARTYPIAFSVSGKSWVNNHAHVLRFKDLPTQKFVEFYLNSIPLNDYVSGMAQPKLNQAMLNVIPVPYPSVTERQAIVTKLNELSEYTGKLETIYQNKLSALTKLKQSILHQAFSGQLH